MARSVVAALRAEDPPRPTAGDRVACVAGVPLGLAIVTVAVAVRAAGRRRWR